MLCCAVLCSALLVVVRVMDVSRFINCSLYTENAREQNDVKVTLENVEHLLLLIRHYFTSAILSLRTI